MKNKPTVIEKQTQKVREEFEKKFLSIYGENDVIRFPATDIWQFIEKALTQAHQEGYEEAVKRIKKAIINEVEGAGELWFPYVSPGNTTKEEQRRCAEQFADDILTTLTKKESKHK